MYCYLFISIEFIFNINTGYRSFYPSKIVETIQFKKKQFDFNISLNFNI